MLGTSNRVEYHAAIFKRRGEHRRSPQLPQITQSRVPRLGKLQGLNAMDRPPLGENHLEFVVTPAG